MPRPADLGPLRAERLTLPNGASSTEWWYQHADGTWSKLLQDRSGGTVGVLSGGSNWVRALIDMDKDGVADYLRIVGFDGKEVVAAAAGRGAAFLDRWRNGENPLCDPRGGGAKTPLAVTEKQRQSGAMPACRPERAGPLTGIAGGSREHSADPLDRVCEGRVSSRATLAGGGPRAYGTAGLAGGDTGRLAGITDTRRAREEAAHQQASVIAAAYADAVYDQAYNMLLKRLDKEKSSPSAGTRAPTAGSEGSRGGDGEAALGAVCTARARANRRWTRTIAEMEKQQAGKGDTDCDDPVTDPAAADSATSFPKCGPPREAKSVSQQLLEELGGYQSRRCGPTERPGPDGGCRGGRNLRDNRGRLWYGYGNVIGVVPCEGRACDPAESP
jgi:hypothetical protein